jgi:hypothetical protein
VSESREGSLEGRSPGPQPGYEPGTKRLAPPVTPVIKFQPTGDFIHIEIIPVCDHPADAIMWNPWNLVTQCHRCGMVIEALMAYNSGDGSRLTGEEMDAVGW